MHRATPILPVSIELLVLTWLDAARGMGTLGRVYWKKMRLEVRTGRWIERKVWRNHKAKSDLTVFKLTHFDKIGKRHAQVGMFGDIVSHLSKLFYKLFQGMSPGNRRRVG